MSTLKTFSAVLLLSGGIDSSVLLFRLLNEGYEITPLHVNYGQVTFPGESIAIQKILPPKLSNNLVVLDVPNIATLGSGSLAGDFPKDTLDQESWLAAEFFPNRNMILISLAAALAWKINAHYIAIGVVGKNTYPDASPKFIKSIKRTLPKTINAIEIIAPYVGKSRISVIKDAKKYFVPINETFSCNALAQRHCLLCNSCHEREDTINTLKKMR
jgi:7-cyano-7-deazaguanine synthase